MKKIVFVFLLCLSLLVTSCTVNLKNDDKDSKQTDNVSDTFENTFSEKNSETDGNEVAIESEGVSSSAKEPLSKDQVGIASKYNAILDAYQDVDVQITNIFENPDELITDFNKNNSDDQITKNDNMKFVALEYEITLVNYETESFGTDAILNVEVANENDESFVVNDIKQIILVKTLKNDTGLVNGSKGKVIIAFAIPNDVVNYLVKFGTNNHTIAYYKL